MSKQNDPEFPRAAAAAAAVHYEDGEPIDNLPHLQNSDNKYRSSWYNDVMMYGGSDDLDKNVRVSEYESNTNNEDDEKLEQFRIMAHIEATIRVKDNTGFDMAEYEKQRKLNPEPNKLNYFDGIRKPKAILPDPKAFPSRTKMEAEEPPLPPPRPNKMYLERRSLLMPDLRDGFTFAGRSIPEGDCVVRCLGCKIQLRVNMFATLVKCPDCSTVSPVTSSKP
jgi:hypothetical protein